MTDTEILPAHSALGASGAHRWLKCPGSFRLSQQAPARRSSIYAATGTLAHQLIEHVLRLALAETGSLKRVKQWDLTDFVGKSTTVEGYEIIVDDDFVDGVRVMLEYVSQASSHYQLMRCEQTVHLDSYFRNRPPPPVKLFGRTDVVMWAPDELEIVDYKNGSGIIVDPTDNAQMLYYAAGMLMAVSQMAPPLSVKRVRMTVVQPHARSVAKIRTAEIDVLDLQMWVDDVLIPGVEACGRSDAQFVPGSWCRFCPVSFACPALIAEANRMAKIEFDDERTIYSDPDELSHQLDLAERASVWVEAVRAYALERLQRQERIPHWGLVPTRPTRRWRDVVAVAEACTDVLHMDRADLMREPEIKSPAQLEKLVRRRIGARHWEETLSPLVESHSSGVKLQRDDDLGDPFDDTS